MPRRRSPPSLDTERLTAMLAGARKARVAALAAGGPHPVGTPGPSRGWVPESEPPDVDTGWVADPWGPGPGETPGQEGPDPGSAPPPGRHRLGPRVLTLPAPFRGARVSVPWRAVVAFAVVVLVAGVVFAVRVARAQEAAVPQVVPAGGLVGRTAPASAFGPGSSGGSSGGPTAGSSALAASAASVSGSASGTPGSANTSVRRLLVIDVVGQVAHPGVVTVPDGSRVGDVLTAAGGALPDADVRRLNLARLVTDGEQLAVPRPGETPTEPLGAGGGAPGTTGLPPTTGSTVPPVVDLNTATLAALDALPGVGPVLAQRILDWRGEHGRFSSVDELGEVSGIGDKLLAQIRSRVRV